MLCCSNGTDKKENIIFKKLHTIKSPSHRQYTAMFDVAGHRSDTTLSQVCIRVYFARFTFSDTVQVDMSIFWLQAVNKADHLSDF